MALSAAGGRVSRALRALLLGALLAALPFGALEVHSTAAAHSAVAETETAVASHPLQPAHLEGSELHRVAACVACLLRLASGAGVLASPGAPLRFETSSHLPLPPDARVRRGGPSTRGGRSPPLA
jgi:hypothetical protein